MDIFFLQPKGILHHCDQLYVFVIFVQEVEGIRSSSNFCVATNTFVRYCWAELVQDEAGVEVVGVQLHLTEMFLLFS